ncbi:MAG: hypothetical protein WBP31_00540 [Chitinophagales bacterium]|jgi:hypothetical protein|nr:hypothetical protein [Bacteroidota bacterium]MBK9505373.1 hypothetical protein [Bacteroidota bacterium]MBK9556508.1 hypothetical protein [Bacteroidota bacterium]MBL0278845.1 hypothetical protein [Bacteroidota bacterium]MBP9879273.1 hypothetical protein [Chitinophagales bacterium]
MDALTREELPIDFDPRWLAVLRQMKEQFGKKPELEAVLFLIGMNELGRVIEKFTKEEKQDLMHIAVCKLLSYDGFYRFAGWDDDNWPMWEAAENLPQWANEDQERAIKLNIIRYFEENNII